MNKQRAIQKLQERLRALERLKVTSVSDPTFQKWHRDTEIALEHIFGRETRHLREFHRINFGVKDSDISMLLPEYAAAFYGGLSSAEALLRSMIKEIREYGVESDKEVALPLTKSHGITKHVFIVHGHDDGARASVARLIAQFDLDPIILHEQPNKGRTIIEKFEEYSDVGFAVVILTGDDRGGVSAKPAESYSPRARQNVILELGFFLGKLGRDRVCVLYQEGVEIPSDYDGVLFVPLDKAGAWPLRLGRELKAAGYDVDLNKIA
jgi:predicted nucleotide-binding protein